MKHIAFAAALLAMPLAACGELSATESAEAEETTTERNKRLAREFYENLWFNNNTGVYADYVAESYVIHDIGDKPDVIVLEESVTQKEIADFFHSMGTMTGTLDYQIAEGDKVATRWYISVEPSEEAAAQGFPPVENVPIINVFRFDESGKIVEIWNHRHDVSLPRPPGEAQPRPDSGS